MGNVVTPMWAESPAITRCIVVGYTSLSLSLTFVSALIALPLRQTFLCSINTTLGNLYLWTLFLSPMFSHFSGGMSFLMMLMELYMGVMYFPKKERELGSLTFLSWLFLATCAQNLTFLLFMAVLCTAEPSKYYEAGTQGLWPLLMVVMSLHHLSDISGSTSFWGVVQIPNKWYPAALVGFFCLLNQAIMWNLLAGIAVGYIAHFQPSLHMERLLPSVAWITSMECRFCGERRSLLGGSWLAAGARGYLPTSQGTESNRVAPSTLGLPSWTSSAPASKGFVVFSGQGNRLGEAEAEQEQVSARADEDHDTTVDNAVPASTATSA